MLLPSPFFMRLFLLTITLASTFSSCYSYKIFPKEYRTYQYRGEKKKAFIINPGLTKEDKIFRKAGIFNLVDDTLDNSTIKIKLHPVQTKFVCGEPILASLFTLGQFPVLLPDTYQYEFDEIQKTDTIHKQLTLQIATRYWFWDMFAFRKKFDQKAGQTLLAKYYND